MERGQLPELMPDWLFDAYAECIFEEIFDLLENDTLSIEDIRFEIDAEKLTHVMNSISVEDLN